MSAGGASVVLAGGPTEGRRLVAFFRDFVQFAGGHLKVWHYFEHVRHSAGHVPVIEFSMRTRWDHDNPWSGLLASGGKVARPLRADVLFLAGLDWLCIEPARRTRSDVPIINLLQGVRHGDRADPLHAFLSHRAIRICVGAEVADSVRGHVNGPVHVIPNGTDLAQLPDAPAWSERAWDVLIVGLKAPELGTALLQGLSGDGRRVRLLDTWVPRSSFLAALADSRVAVLLPTPREGFYLPAIEAMALGTLVVCPECVGTRSFALPGDNCLRPAYTAAALIQAAVALLTAGPERRGAMLAAARQTAQRHDLLTERRAFLELLEGARGLW